MRSKQEKNPEAEVIRRMKEALYSQLSPRDYFADDVVLHYIVEPHKVPKTLFYLDRSKEFTLEKREDGIKAESTTVPKTEEEFLLSVGRHRRFKPPGIYLTLFESYEEVLDWAKAHSNHAKRECQIWRIDGEKLRGKSSLVLVEWQYTVD